ncbi:hypothetical protein M422DRAFT_30646 [Sphaerobolus stellatus SS14]|uniref:Enoyl reductase (ER) domain-containing protein n=1 Tax=Sphaerobolus stellatus (strain SS14) TaxID=990650 RepID=A0A0C9VYN8_SPHS4|nr:hypothetical protein M422DRAFT_30646 [Sphaerobolus stellatus SS14]
MSSNDIPQAQHAWIVIKRGHPSQAVVLQKDFPVSSKLKKGEALVKVHAAALNPVGWKIMRLLPNIIAKRPQIAEYDLAGTIADSNGTEFNKGDEIFGWLPVPLSIKSGQGALAQYVRLPADHLVAKPSSIDFIHAAGICLAGMTALQGLKQAGIEAGQTVFINGGTTAVGSFAIQIAKAKGCNVVATTSTPNIDIVKGLGADKVIDYKNNPPISHLKENPPTPNFHVIYDTVGTSAELFTASPAYLAPNGIFVSVGVTMGGLGNILKSVFQTQLRPSWLGGTNRKFRLVSVNNKKEDLEELRDLIGEGKLKPLVDSTFSFDDVLKAYERIMTGRAKGKVAVQVISN